MKKLNLGSGPKRYLDYTSCDKFPGRDVDEVFSLDKIPYPDNSIDAIHSEHALEHLDHYSARNALKEWQRVLVPGGVMHLQIPDLEECCRQFLLSPTKAHRDWFRYTIYGIQRSLSDEPPEAQFHATGWTIEEIQDDLRNVGFEIVEAKKYDGYGTPSIEVLARKK